MWNPLQYYRKQVEKKRERDQQLVDATLKMKRDLLEDFLTQREDIAKLRKSDKYTDFEKEVLIHIREQKLAKSLELFTKANIYF